MVTKKIKYLILLPTFLIFISCGKNVIFTDSMEMPGKVWKLADIASYRIPVKDTISANDISFLIRTGTSYPFRNIYIFVTTISPAGKSITDTLQYDLADEKGNWFGKGFGDIHEMKLPYKSGVFFPVSGTYQIFVQHGMRTEDLKGVYDFDIRVEKTVK